MYSALVWVTYSFEGYVEYNPGSPSFTVKALSSRRLTNKFLHRILPCTKPFSSYNKRKQSVKFACWLL